MILLSSYYSRSSDESFGERLVDGLVGTGLFGYAIPILLVLTGIVLLMYFKGVDKLHQYIWIPVVLLSAGVLWWFVFWYAF